MTVYLLVQNNAVGDDSHISQLFLFTVSHDRKDILMKLSTYFDEISVQYVKNCDITVGGWNGQYIEWSSMIRIVVTSH